jgi:hypothetical protein
MVTFLHGRTMKRNNAMAHDTKKMTRDYHESLDMARPMAAARCVRRDRYAWPGAYALALVTTDGGVLCPDCVRDNFASISWAHRNSCSNGWQPVGMMCESETDDVTLCDHCGRVIFNSEG